ncbi:putative HPT domain superfamily protein [Helianthus anomalus]
MRGQYYIYIDISFYWSGYLDEQFIQLEELQDNYNPNFIEEVVTLFYRDSARFLISLDQALYANLIFYVCLKFKNILTSDQLNQLTFDFRGKRPLDFTKLDNLMHQFQSRSTSIGAKKVKTECTHFKNYCNAKNVEGCHNYHFALF